MTINRFLEPMTALHHAHRDFKRAWKSWNDAKAKEKVRAEEETITAREAFWTAFNDLFDLSLNPLRRNFIYDPQTVIDDVIDFLSVDVPCFRCGYEKEWYLRRLKSVSLSTNQRQRLKSIALDLARGSDYRREFKEWCRLMIVLADGRFLTDLKEAAAAPMETGRNRPKRMLQTILHHRPDLERSPSSTCPS
jgi:hypothetical protein